MTLAQVQGTIALVAFLIATWAGLVIAMALLLPKQAAIAEAEVAQSPVKNFFIGLLMQIPVSICIGMIRIPVGAVKLIGFVGLVALGAALAIGSSGMATLMGRRISNMAGDGHSFTGLLRGSLAFSLAMGFPLIGWFLFTPVALMISYGAGARAMLKSMLEHPPVAPVRQDFDGMEPRGTV